MSERFYLYLLALYPKRFREKYAPAALELFRDRLRDERGCFARARLWWDLILDAAISIPSEYGREEPIDWQAPVQNAAPVFYSFDTEWPRRGALGYGAILTTCMFAGVAFMMHDRDSPSVWLVGSHHPSPSHMLPTPTKAVATSELESEVKLKTSPFERPTSAYFKLVLVLRALDSDHDGEISAFEIVNAPAALGSLDTSHDGTLSAEECGFRPPGADPQLVSRARVAFMTVHPALAALDSDHDGVISAREIAYAAGALRTLDRNGDGRLTENEVLPDPILWNVVQLMLALDTDGDGRISAAEASRAHSRLRALALFDRADLNHDGFVTEEELTAAVRSGALTHQR